MRPKPQPCEAEPSPLRPIPLSGPPRASAKTAVPKAEQDGQGKQAEEYPDRLARRYSKERTSNYARHNGDSPDAEQDASFLFERHVHDAFRPGPHVVPNNTTRNWTQSRYIYQFCCGSAMKN